MAGEGDAEDLGTGEDMDGCHAIRCGCGVQGDLQVVTLDGARLERPVECRMRRHKRRDQGGQVGDVHAGSQSPRGQDLHQPLLRDQMAGSDPRGPPRCAACRGCAARRVRPPGSPAPDPPPAARRLRRAGQRSPCFRDLMADGPAPRIRSRTVTRPAGPSAAPRARRWRHGVGMKRRGPVRRPASGPLTCVLLVGDTGLEPVTSSVSGKRASQTAPIAHAGRARGGDGI